MSSSRNNRSLLYPLLDINPDQVLLFITGNDYQRSIFFEKMTEEGNTQITEISLKGDLRKQDGFLSSYRNFSRMDATAKWDGEKNHCNVNLDEANTIKSPFQFFYASNCTFEKAEALKNAMLTETNSIFLLEIDSYIENSVKEHVGSTVQYQPIINKSHGCVIS